MHAAAPTATYRFQLTPTFGFDRAAAQLPRLQALGVSHVYLSPITEAVPGSTHGYDVVDHTTVRDELGGLDGPGGAPRRPAPSGTSVCSSTTSPTTCPSPGPS